MLAVAAAVAWWYMRKPEKPEQDAAPVTGSALFLYTASGTSLQCLTFNTSGSVPTAVLSKCPSDRDASAVWTRSGKHIVAPRPAPTEGEPEPPALALASRDGVVVVEPYDVDDAAQHWTMDTATHRITNVETEVALSDVDRWQWTTQLPKQREMALTEELDSLAGRVKVLRTEAKALEDTLPFNPTPAMIRTLHKGVQAKLKAAEALEVQILASTEKMAMKPTSGPAAQASSDMSALRAFAEGIEGRLTAATMLDKTAAEAAIRENFALLKSNHDALLADTLDTIDGAFTATNETWQAKVADLQRHTEGRARDTGTVHHFVQEIVKYKAATTDAFMQDFDYATLFDAVKARYAEYKAIGEATIKANAEAEDALKKTDAPVEKLFNGDIARFAIMRFAGASSRFVYRDGDALLAGGPDKHELTNLTLARHPSNTFDTTFITEFKDNKVGTKCLDATGGAATFKTCDAGVPGQNWDLDGTKVRDKRDAVLRTKPDANGRRFFLGVKTATNTVVSRRNEALPAGIQSIEGVGNGTLTRTFVIAGKVSDTWKILKINGRYVEISDAPTKSDGSVNTDVIATTQNHPGLFVHHNKAIVTADGHRRLSFAAPMGAANDSNYMILAVNINEQVPVQFTFYDDRVKGGIRGEHQWEMMTSSGEAKMRYRNTQGNWAYMKRIWVPRYVHMSDMPVPKPMDHVAIQSDKADCNFGHTGSYTSRRGKFSTPPLVKHTIWNGQTSFPMLVCGKNSDRYPVAPAKTVQVFKLGNINEQVAGERWERVLHWDDENISKTPDGSHDLPGDRSMYVWTEIDMTNAQNLSYNSDEPLRGTKLQWGRTVASKKDRQPFLVRLGGKTSSVKDTCLGSDANGIKTREAILGLNDADGEALFICQAPTSTTGNGDARREFM